MFLYTSLFPAGYVVISTGFMEESLWKRTDFIWMYRMYWSFGVEKKQVCSSVVYVTSWRVSVAWPLVPESLWCLLSAHWLQDSQTSCPWDHMTMRWILQFIPACRLWAETSDFSSSETWTWGSPSLSSEFMTGPWLSQQTPGTVFLRSLIEHLRLLQRSHLS